MKYTIEVPEGTLPEDYYPVRFGIPHPKEYFWSPLNTVESGKAHKGTTSCLVLRKKFVWPSWLKAAYIARDSNNPNGHPVVRCYAAKPTWSEQYQVWTSTGANAMLTSIAPFVDFDFDSIQPGECIKNPNNTDPEPL